MQLGWKKDPFDPRAIYYSSLPKVKKLVTFPARVNYEWMLPPDAPWDQLDKGHCVGFGEGMNLTMRAVEQKVYSKINQRFSPEWIVDGAQELEGTTGQDAGAMPTDGWVWLMSHGCLLESFYPYTGKVLKKKPSTLNLDKYAMQWPMGSNFIRCDDGIFGIQVSLAVGNPVSIGTPWYEKWISVKPDGILASITTKDEIAGGHETCLLGYETIKNRLYFRGINSWGKDWGDSGLYWMPATAFSVFKKIPAEEGGQYDAQFPLLPREWGPH